MCVRRPRKTSARPRTWRWFQSSRGRWPSDELILHYQPKIVLKTGRVTGVEALVRWQHPTRGLVAPDEFIPIAQETGLIRPLTLYVIDEALRQCQRWRTRGHELAVAVNVSIRNLIDARFPGDVSGCCMSTRSRLTLLELEITETAIVSDPYRSKTVLDRLAAMGVRLAVDDFGTGYTSLGYLKRLPINELKIDRSFVANMLSCEEDAVIVRSTIDLGHNLGLEVVAEGVENADALADLDTLGCDVAQGFYVSRPVAGEELTEWLECLPASAGEPQWAAEPKSDGPVVVGHGRLTHRGCRPGGGRGSRHTECASPSSDATLAPCPRACTRWRGADLRAEYRRRPAEGTCRRRRRASAVQPTDGPRALRRPWRAGSRPVRARDDAGSQRRSRARSHRGASGGRRRAVGHTELGRDTWCAT